MNTKIKQRIEILNTLERAKKVEKSRKPAKKVLKTLRWGFRTFGNLTPRLATQVAYFFFSQPRHRAQHKFSDINLETAQEDFIFFEGLKIKIYSWKNENLTTPKGKVLLAHGWESRGTALRMYVQPLLEKGYEIVAFDAIGHGDSEGKRTNMPENARLIAHLIRHFGGVHAVIGHSFGCSSTTFALQKNPDLYIEKLVFIAVPHSVRRLMDDYFELLHIPNIVKMRFKTMVEHIATEKVEHLNVATAYPSVSVGNLLLVHDRYDNVTTFDAAENVFDSWDNAFLLITEGLGHFRLAKNPEVIARIVQFIEEK